MLKKRCYTVNIPGLENYKLCLRDDAMVQSASMSKTWASSDAAAEEAPQALTYKVEVYTGDVRGAGTHVRIGNMHSEIVHRHLCACFSVHTCTSMLELVDLMCYRCAKMLLQSCGYGVLLLLLLLHRLRSSNDGAGTSCSTVDRD